MKPNIVSTLSKDFFHKDVIKRITETTNAKYGPYTQEQFILDIPKFDGIIIGGEKILINEEVLQAALNLKVVSRYGVGYDNIDIEACTRHKVYVTFTPVLSEAVAELAFTFMLSLSKLIFKADKFTREEWSKSKLFFPLGKDLYKKTLGIIGLGRISYQVAKRAHAFDMSILYADVVRNEQAEKKFNAKHVTLDELLKKSDYVSIHAPLNMQTKGMIGEHQLKLMKESAFLINTARGGIVDYQALTKVLKEKRIAGAGLDVFAVEPIERNDPLLKLDNVILSPHIGSGTVETRRKMGMLALDNILNVFYGESPKYLVPEQRISKI